MSPKKNKIFGILFKNDRKQLVQIVKGVFLVCPGSVLFRRRFAAAALVINYTFVPGLCVMRQELFVELSVFGKAVDIDYDRFSRNISWYVLVIRKDGELAGTEEAIAWFMLDNNLPMFERIVPDLLQLELAESMNLHQSRL